MDHIWGIVGVYLSHNWDIVESLLIKVGTYLGHSWDIVGAWLGRNSGIDGPKNSR